MISESKAESPPKSPLSSIDQMLKVAFRFYDKNLFQQQLAQGLDAATGSTSMTYGYRIGNFEEN
jgi:hypothetical protein